MTIDEYLEERAIIGIPFLARWAGYGEYWVVKVSDTEYTGLLMSDDILDNPSIVRIHDSTTQPWTLVDTIQENTIGDLPTWF